MQLEIQSSKMLISYANVNGIYKDNEEKGIWKIQFIYF